MTSVRARLLTRVSAWGAAAALIVSGAGATSAAAAGAGTTGPDPAALLRAVRPDFGRYISGLRAFDGPDAARFYMALVRPGASDPGSPASAPLAGAGARNDVVFRRAALGGERSAGWVLLLLDHEYFHARHLAGATTLPLPGPVPAAVERHFFEAAAWGWNVAEARAGRYPGLRPDEFREALDRYGEHYAALRDLLRRSDDPAWRSLSVLLRQPALLLRAAGGPPPGVPARPSGPGRAPGTR